MSHEPPTEPPTSEFWCEHCQKTAMRAWPHENYNLCNTCQSVMIPVAEDPRVTVLIEGMTEQLNKKRALLIISRAIDMLGDLKRYEIPIEVALRASLAVAYLIESRDQLKQ